MQRIGSPAPWMDALRALAQGKGSIRLLSATTTAHPADEGARDGRSCCARVLAVRSNGSVFVEQPPGGPMDWLALDQEVEVLIEHHAQRWCGRSTVLGQLSYRLSSDLAPRQALRLGPMSQVVSAQRRRFFRVDMAGIDWPLVRIMSRCQGAAPASEDAADLDDCLIRAKLLNLSGGGMGLQVEAADRRVVDLLKGQRYRCLLPLPQWGKPLLINARLVRIQRMRGKMVYLGLRFEFDHDAQQRHAEDLLVRVTTELQRQQLRGQRTA